MVVFSKILDLRLEYIGLEQIEILNELNFVLSLNDLYGN